MSTRRKLGSKQAYRVIHRPYPWSRSVPGWKAGLRRSAPTYGKRSALEACSRRCAIQIHNLLYFTLLYLLTMLDEKYKHVRCVTFVAWMICGAWVMCSVLLKIASWTERAERRDKALIALYDQLLKLFISGLCFLVEASSHGVYRCNVLRIYTIQPVTDSYQLISCELERAFVACCLCIV